MIVRGDPKLAYEQDGKLFDEAGNQVGPVLSIVEHVDQKVTPITHSEKMKAAWARRKNAS